jgi:dethiobiotin synthetase
MGLPVALVVANKLGAINHTLLTLAAIRARGLACAGLILNRPTADDDLATTTNRAMLEDLAGVPILFEIAHGQRELPLP